MLKNRLNHWRHELRFNKQKDFAEFLGVSKWSLNQWENQKTQPDAPSLWKIYIKLKERIPELHMEDLLEEVPD